MKKIVIFLLLLLFLANPVSAQGIDVPQPPDEAVDLLPEDRDSFGEGLWYVCKSSLQLLLPEIAQSCGVCLSLVGAVLLMSLLQSYEGKSKKVVELSGVVAIACLLLKPANSMIRLGAETVSELSEYGKLLIPVMTAALAAQGGAASSASLYAATAMFDAILSSMISGLLVPLMYIFLAIVVANAATGDSLMKKIGDLIKWFTSWGLKSILYIFTGYISITGVVSGTADQTAVKAAKLTISGMVPVVGGILSDASETILVSAGMVKNAAGIYGMLAVIAIAIGPFLKIAVHYFLLKLTGAVCAMFSDKKISGLIEDFSGAMGLLLAMTGSLCLMLLISVVCFLKGMG